MRISDWSSDVCSSDLPGRRHHDEKHQRGRQQHGCEGKQNDEGEHLHPGLHAACARLAAGLSLRCPALSERSPCCPATSCLHYRLCHATAPTSGRSEEHTSELQSLMRISYAVFCLKKKTTTNNKSYHRRIPKHETTI